MTRPNDSHGIDVTIIDRQEAYLMYVRGEITRNQLYDYLHDRIMWLNGIDINKEDADKKD
jgi:hypothetical protein